MEIRHACAQTGGVHEVKTRNGHLWCIQFIVGVYAYVCVDAFGGGEGWGGGQDKRPPKLDNMYHSSRPVQEKGCKMNRLLLVLLVLLLVLLVLLVCRGPLLCLPVVNLLLPPLSRAISTSLLEAALQLPALLLLILTRLLLLPPLSLLLAMALLVVLAPLLVLTHLLVLALLLLCRVSL